MNKFWNGHQNILLAIKKKRKYLNKSNYMFGFEVSVDFD